MTEEKSIYKRNCPTCNISIVYGTIWSLKRAITNESLCKKCSAISRMEKVNLSGKNNPMFGKHHSNKTKQLLSKIKIGKKLEGKELDRARETIKIAQATAAQKTRFEWWVQKYGIEIATQKHKEAYAHFPSGKNHHSYGKSPPKSSGGGWACWYKNIHFRSFRELFYYLNIILPTNSIFEKGELKKFRIPYRLQGKDRTYAPDFFVNNYILVEIKPKYLWGSEEIVAKKNAAIEFCQKRGWRYELIDVKIDLEFIKDYYLNGEIKFVKHKFEQRFRKKVKIPDNIPFTTKPKPEKTVTSSV